MQPTEDEYEMLKYEMNMTLAEGREAIVELGHGGVRTKFKVPIVVTSRLCAWVVYRAVNTAAILQQLG